MQMIRRIARCVKHTLVKDGIAPPKFETTIFRNDDVSYDSNVEHFREFCEVFHRYGFIQLHAINLYGRTNCICVKNGIPALYESINPEDIYDYEICKSVSVDYIGNNKELIEYLNSIPDSIGLHGLYHSDYSKMSYSQQEEDIKEGLRLLHELFPNKKIDTFIAPFNHVNEDTYKVCQKYGLRVSALEGEHLEEMIANKQGTIVEGQLYRYHHHRFYPESTFDYYDLSISALDNFLKENSYTINKKTNKVIPSQAMFSAYVDLCNAQQKYLQEFMDFTSNKYACCTIKHIERYVKKDAKILEAACGAGGMLYALNSIGYSNLSGYDDDVKAINVAKRISEDISAGINLYVDDVANPTYGQVYDAIVMTNRIYHHNDFSLDDFLYNHCRMLKDGGYFILEVFGSAFEGGLCNEFMTQKCEGEVTNKRQSEDKNNLSKENISAIVKRHNSKIIKCCMVNDVIPKMVYIIQYKKPRICFLCDRPNWAHHYSAVEIEKNLCDEFDIDIKYVVNNPNIHQREYDAILVYFWGETIYKKYKFPRDKLIKQVSSHRWEDDPQYGPCTPNEFVNRYISDASTVICPSLILYRLLEPYTDNLFLCGKGFSPNLLYYKKERQGELSLCMVGNLKDPVKGVEDILKPASEGYKVDLANDIEHDKLVHFYNQHDVYVVSSRHEADPLPLIESMACGCFPISTAIGIAPELIRHKENGYIVAERTVSAFREAIEWCNQNLSYVRKQGKKNAEEMYCKRRWEVMAENYRVMLRDHIARSKSE